VARFLLTRNIFEGEVQDGPGEHNVFCMEEAKLAVATDLRGRRHASIRAEDILISKEPIHTNGFNSLVSTITRIADRGTFVHVTVNVPPEFTCLILHRSLEEMGLEEKQNVFIAFKASAVNVF